MFKIDKYGYFSVSTLLFQLAILCSFSLSLSVTLPLTEAKNRHTMSLKKEFLLTLKNTFKLEGFIETGTAFGNTIKEVVPYFNYIASVEINETLFNHNKLQFKNISNVYLYHGTSERYLRSMIEGSSKNTLLWLDGHNSPAENFHDAINNCPLLNEIEIIAQTSNYKKNVILIDDVRCSLWPLNNWNNIGKNQELYQKIGDGWPIFSEIYDKLKTINKNYAVGVIGDIMIAFDENHFRVKMNPFAKECADICYALCKNKKITTSTFIGEESKKILFCDSLSFEDFETAEYHAHLNLFRYIYCIKKNQPHIASTFKQKCQLAHCASINRIIDTLSKK